LAAIPTGGTKRVQTIAKWLASLGLADYAERFVENDIDLAVLPDLTEKHLKDLGVSVGHRLKILRAIRDLGIPPAVHPAADGLVAKDRAERRQVTVMFCDLVGSTELSQRLDPEDFTDLIRSYRETCSRNIYEAGGSIGRFVGDGILAYFGFPQAHEDDTARACRAGLRIIEVLARRQETIALKARIACATGLAVVGDIVGEGIAESQAIMGAAPNLAARLQSLAAPGTLVISDETRALIGDLFECEDRGAHDIKGISEPTRVWRVLGERHHESRFAARVRGRPQHVVGRQAELELLLSRWKSVRSGGRGEIALIAGDPGIGKSRLAHALREMIAAEPSNILLCQCSAYHQTTALYPFIEWLERIVFHFDRDDSPPERIAKLENQLERYGCEPAVAAPPLVHLLSIPNGDQYRSAAASPERRKQQTIDALVRIVLAHATERPALLVIEDLHWADPTTLEVLGVLLERIPDAKLMGLLTFRPDFVPPWKGLRPLSAIALNRLDPDSSAAMVEHVSGGRSMPAEIRQQIITKADGVPLFVEELTKTVLESGLLREVDGRLELARPLTPFAMPTTLTDSLMARLDRLGTVKIKAQAFATLGREFSYELARTVFEFTDEDLTRDLDQLLAAELLDATGKPPVSTYTFKHALIQEAAYESLLRRTRQEYHERIANVLLKQFSNTSVTRPETIAQHFTKGGLAAQAIPFWAQAAQAAMQRSANLEAIAHVTTALDLLATLPASEARDQQELSLKMLLAIPLTLTRGWAAPDVGSVYQRASELSRAYGETPKLFPTLVGVLTYYLVRGQFRIAYEMGRRNWQAAQRIGDPEVILEAEVDRGTTSYYLGRFSESLPHLERVGELYDPTVHHHHVFTYGKDPGAVALVHKSHALWCLGFPCQSKRAANEAKALTTRWIHPFSDVWSDIGLAFGAQVRGDAAAVVKIGESIIAQSIEQVFPNWLAQGMVFRGWGLSYLGDTDQGISLMRQGLELWAQTGAELRKTYLLSMLADGYIRAGRTADALETIETALGQAERTEERFWESELHRQHGEVLLLQQGEDAAQACFMHAFESARGRSQRSLELRAATSQARLWQSQGQIEKARAVLEPIYSWFTEGFDSHDLMAARSVLASFDTAVEGAR
jgi:class 3 adenylate cyclase/predicted ATPase